MAFVYCDDRWKINDQSDMPGPGEYLNLNQQQSPKSQHAHIKYKLMQTIKKKQANKHSQIKSNDIVTCINKQQVKHKTQQNQPQKMSLAKRKQYIKNNSTEMLNQVQLIKVDLTGCITNITNSKSKGNIKNKWGNMKLKQLLKEMSKTTQQCKDLQKLNIKYNLNTFHIKKREQFQQERKELQNNFNDARKGTNCKVNGSYRLGQKQNCIQDVNHKIAKKEQRLQRKSVNLQIQPTFVYRTVNNGGHSRPQTTCKSSQSSFSRPFLYRNESTKTNQQTGLEDNSFEDEDSIQYIEDATPGPGAYNLSSEKLINKHQTNIGKFGVTIQRFKSQKRLFHEAQTPIHPAYPQFKKSSKALPEEVGFGKSLKQQKYQSNKLHDNFYENYNTLEHKSKKLLSQSKNQKNVCFSSIKERFKNQKKDIGIQDFILQNNEHQQKLQTIEEDKQNNCQKPMSIFLSKVTRDLHYHNQMPQTDYHGQNYNCIANKLKQSINRQQQFQLKPPYFLTTSKRFNYEESSKLNDNAKNISKQEDKSASKDTLRIIRVAEIKKKKQDNCKKPEKGYTFQKQSAKESFGHQQKTPSPDKYSYGPSWVKNSYNIKFKIHEN